jgi:hypothetical protein
MSQSGELDQGSCAQTIRCAHNTRHPAIMGINFPYGARMDVASVIEVLLKCAMKRAEV